MIRQIVTFNFADHADDATRDAILAELDGFPEHFPQMRGWSCGPNVSRRDSTYAHAFVVDFETEADLNAYLDSDLHIEFVADRWRPAVDDRAIVTFAYTPRP